jgi:hypothetical protein
MVWAILNDLQKTALNELLQPNQSDRAFAILSGALLDDSLRTALELRLRPKSGKSDMSEKLFKVGGPLGNTGPKIALGYQLYMLDKPARNTLYGLSEIRNLFAHKLDMSFQAGSMKLTEGLEKLELHKDRTHYPSNTWWPAAGDEVQVIQIETITNNRELFTVNLKLALHVLMDD